MPEYSIDVNKDNAGMIAHRCKVSFPWDTGAERTDCRKSHNQQQQPADILTKPLGYGKFARHWAFL